MTSVLAAVAAASTLVLTGCQDHESSAQTSESPSASERPGPSASEPTPLPSAVDAIRLVAADGSTLTVHWVDAPKAPAVMGTDYDVDSTLTVPKTCGQELAPRVLLDDTAWFVGIRPAALCTWQGEATLPAGYGVGVVRPGAQSVTPWRSTSTLVPGDAPRQVTNGAADGDTVVWSETASTGLDVDNWRVFAASRTDGNPHLVARAEELTGGNDLPFYDSTYTIADGKVYWGTAAAPTVATEGVSAPEVVAKDLTGRGSITVVARDADQPVTTDQGVVVRTIAMNSDIVQDAYGKAQTQQRMTATGLALVTPGGVTPLVRIVSDAPLPFGVHVDALAGFGSHVAFAVGPTEYVLDLTTGAVTGFRAQGNPLPGGDPQVLTAPVVVKSSAASADLVAWSYGSGTASGAQPVFVYNLARDALYRIDVPLNGGSTWAAGRHVAWNASDGEHDAETLTNWGG